MNHSLLPRGARPATTSLLLLATVVSAQNYQPGDLLVSLATNPPLTRRIECVQPNGAAFPITGFNTPPGLTAMEIDPVTGDLIYAVDTAAGIDVRRAAIGGSSVVSEAVILSLPNTVGHTASYIHREPTGGFLLLTAFFDASISSYRQFVYRIGLTRTGAIANLVQALPTSLPLLTDIAIGVGDSILMTGPGQPTASSVFSMPFSGGAVTVAPALTSSQIRAFSLEADPMTGQVLMGGTARTVTAPGPVNIGCSQGGSTFANSLIGSVGISTQGCVDLQLDPASGTVLAALNGNGTSIIDRHFTPGCGLGFANTLFTSPAGFAIHKMSLFQPNRAYGFAKASPTGAVPFASEIAAPRQGFSWIVQVDRVLGVSPSLPVMFLGYDDAAPLPIDLSVLGAGFVNAAAFVPVVEEHLGVAVAGVPGQFRVTIPVPVNPALVGLIGFAQWGFLDGSSFSHSNALISTPVQ